MFDLVERTGMLMEDSKLFSSIIREERGDKDPGAFAFSMVHNKAMITREMYQFYYRLWTGGPIQMDFDESDITTEMVERAVYLGKMLFVEVLSAIEYSAKKIAKEAGLLDGVTSLRSIMELSYNEGRMTADRNQEWNDLITVRNLAVHDNSISDRSKRCVIGDVTISMRPNRMMKGPLHTFVELSRSANQFFYEWISSVRPSLLAEGNV